MTPLRKTSFIAGVIYVITFASIPTLSLYSSIHEPGYILGSGPDTNVLIGCVLEIVVALSGIATAVVLYPILKIQNRAMALGLVSSRILEASMIFGGVAFLLSVVTLRQTGAGEEALIIGRAFVTMYDRLFLVGQSLMPAVNDILLGLLLYHSRLVPRTLAVIGVIGGPLLLSSDVCVLFGIIGQRDPLAMMSAIPVALFELGLGVWLIVKGFNVRSYASFS